MYQFLTALRAWEDRWDKGPHRPPLVQTPTLQKPTTTRKCRVGHSSVTGGGGGGEVTGSDVGSVTYQPPAECDGVDVEVPDQAEVMVHML